MEGNPYKILISKKLSGLDRPEITKKVSRMITSYGSTGEDFLKYHLNKYKGNQKGICKQINGISASDSRMGEFFRKLIMINAESIGKGEILLDLVLCDAVSMRPEDPDLNIRKRNYEVKKLSQSKIQFSEKHTENTDFGLLVRMIQTAFKDHQDLYGKNMNRVSREQILNCKRLIKLFFNPNNRCIYRRRQTVVAIENILYRFSGNCLEKITKNIEKYKLIYAIDVFRNMINSSRESFSKETRDFLDGNLSNFYEFIEEVFSSYTLKSILRDAKGIYIVNDAHQFIYLAKSKITTKTEIYINTISRNKIIFSFTKNITKKISVPPGWNDLFPYSDLRLGMANKPFFDTRDF